MSRYCKIDVKIWNDKRFRQLNNAAKLVFFLLLTHPNMSMLGTLRGSKESLAYEINVTSDAMADAMSDVINSGMAHVDDMGLIFIPNFLKYNPPVSPQSLKNWDSIIENLPECELKNVVCQHVFTFANENLSELMRGKLPNRFWDLVKNQNVETVSDGIQHGISDGIQSGIVDDNSHATTRACEREPAPNTQHTTHISTNVDKKKNKKEKSQPLEKPEDVTDTTWADYSLLRDKLKAPLTQTALNAIRKEAEKAGISLEDALKTCCMRGWRGFKSDWIRPKSGTGYVRQTTTPAQEDFMRDDYWANEPEEMIP